TTRDDVAFATLGYSSDVVGNIHVSWTDPDKVREVVAVGSRRRVVFNDLNDGERVRVFERGVSAGEAIVDSYGEVKLLVRDGDIGDVFETGHHAVVREENRIGSHCALWDNSTIDYGCVIGDRVKIHCNVYIAQFTVIEDDVFLAPGVTIANDPHPICGKCMQGPTIRRGARVGVNVTLLPLITIGENALVGAGSVVTADV